MTQLDPRYRGKDFLIGFLPSLILALINGALVFTSEDPAMLNVMFISGAVLLAGAIIALIFRRRFIAVGIVTVLASTPLLMIGSCFALSSIN
jgi:hypothetical protein